MNKEVQRYMDAVPEDRKQVVGKLHALIIGLYPNAEVELFVRAFATEVSVGVSSNVTRSSWNSIVFLINVKSMKVNRVWSH